MPVAWGSADNIKSKCSEAAIGNHDAMRAVAPSYLIKQCRIFLSARNRFTTINEAIPSSILVCFQAQTKLFISRYGPVTHRDVSAPAQSCRNLGPRFIGAQRRLHRLRVADIHRLPEVHRLLAPLYKHRSSSLPPSPSLRYAPTSDITASCAKVSTSPLLFQIATV